MALDPNMHVLLRELPQTRDITLASHFVREALAGMAMRAALERPADDPEAGEAHVHIELHADQDGNVYARGHMTGWFDVACSRCLSAVRGELDERIAVTFVPKDRLPAQDLEHHEVEGEEGIELTEEDIDLYGYEDDTVILEPLLSELLILSVPFAPLCSEACKGLCPQCGADRNREPCACEPPIDPRLAALKNLKL